MLKKIFLIHHTHMDIGYTDLPIEVMDQHLNHLDKALLLCQNNKDYFWTIESAYLVRDYLRNRPKECRDKLLHALKQGRMELQAFETQSLTELLSADELFRCVEYACSLADEHGFKVKSAMINDIGGYAGRIPTVLDFHGVRYLTAGVGAFQVHIPWAKLPHLFYLKAKDGARTLVWNLGIDRNITPLDMSDLSSAVYGMGDTFLITPAMKEYFGFNERGAEIDIQKEDNKVISTEVKFAELTERLNHENYPYEEILLQDGGDNGGPSERLPEVIKKLNSIGKFPEIRLTTPSCFFEHMEDKYGGAIPELQGIITDPWNMRANPAPVPLKKFRAAQRICYSAFARLALIDPALSESISGKINAIEENLQLYGDHTCGLSEWNWQKEINSDGCRGIAYDRYRESWKEKAFYADIAYDGALKIDRMVRKNLVPNVTHGKPAIIIWNSSSVKASGTAEIYLGREYQPIHSLEDEAGRNVLFQEVGPSRYLLHVENVAALGTKILRPYFSSIAKDMQSIDKEKIPDVFENDFFRIKLSSQNGGILSLTCKSSGKELLDLTSRWKFGDFIYQQLDDVEISGKYSGMMTSKRTHYSDPEIIGAELLLNGPVALKVRQKGRMTMETGIVRFERDLILYHASPRIDVHLRINKPETEHKESCYVAFPFAGENGLFKFDQNVGMITLEKDLLPGAMQDLFYCSRFVSVGGAHFNALVCCPDAPVVQLGAINTTQWLQQYPFNPQRNHIYGQIYHNLLNTDCPIWQDILETFRYQVFIRPGNFDYTVAQKDWTSATSLSAEYSNGDITAELPQLIPLEILPEKIRLLSLRRAGETCHLILENPDSETVTVKIKYRNKSQDILIEPFGIVSKKMKI